MITPIEQVLDKARWAPSGDNTQPWRFQVLSTTEAFIHTFDTRRHCVYDLTGAPSQIGVGALLETARLAATGLRMQAEIERLPTPSEEKLQFSLKLVEDRSLVPSPLIPFIESRCTNRRPYSRRPLTAAEKATLEASVGNSYSLLWLEGHKRWEMAKLMFKSAKIRLTIKEAYDVHASVIEWSARVSETKIPDQAVGLDPVGLALMRWAMKSWGRTRFLSTYLGGTLLPRLQLELLPALGCAAHVAIIADCPPKSVDDWVSAGAAVQRLWLSAARLGLQHQPEMTPLIFSGYAKGGIRFSKAAKAIAAAAAGSRELSELLGPSQPEAVVWLGRLGWGSPPFARSLRRPLATAMVSTRGDSPLDR